MFSFKYCYLSNIVIFHQFWCYFHVREACFCFSRQQICSPLVYKWLWLSLILRDSAVHLLPPPEDRARFFVATCGAVGWVCVRKPLHLPRNQQGGVSSRNSCTGSSQQFEEGVPQGCSPFLGGINEICSLHPSCTIQHLTKNWAVFPWHRDWRRSPRATSFVWTAIRRASGDGVAERSEVEARLVEYQSSKHEQYRLEPSSTRSRPDVRTSWRFALCRLVFVLASFCSKYVSWPMT